MTRHSFHFLQTRTALAAASLLALMAGAASAQTTPASQSASSATATTSSATGSATALDRADRRFVEKAAQGGKSEVALGKLAQERAANAQVKSFGERMATDHAKANDDLMKLAGAQGMTLPEPDKSEQHDLDRLSKLSGADFDKAYMKHMVADHKKDVAEFRKAAHSAKDGAVRDFASRTLPTLESHLKMAQSVEAEVKHGGAAAPAAMGASR